VSDDDRDDDEPTPRRVVTPSERRRHMERYPHGVPVIKSSEDRDLAARRNGNHRPSLHLAVADYADDEVTSPIDLFAPARRERRRTPGQISEIELAGRLRAADGDAYEAIAVLAVELSAAKVKERSANRELESQFKKFLDQQPGGPKFESVIRDVERLVQAIDGTAKTDGLAKTVADHDKVVSPTRRIATWAAGIAFTAVLAVGAFLYQRGSSDQSIHDQLQQLARDLARLERQVDHIPAPQGHTP
jgi:hypothetical protein